MSKKEWAAIPPDVHEVLRQAKWFIEHVSVLLGDEAYSHEWNRAGLAIDCSVEADKIAELLSAYGLPSSWEPCWLTDPETDAEMIERKLSR